MSTSSRSAFAGYRRLLLVVLVVLLAFGGAGALLLQFQGPRLSSVDYDPAALTDSAQQRVIFTFNQSLADVDPGQVKVSPQQPFTLESNGRFLAVQFTAPLAADTGYEISLQGLHGESSANSIDLVQQIQTAPAEVLMLRRNNSADDEIVQLRGDGADAEVIYRAPQIEMMRGGREGAVVVLTVPDAASDSSSQLWLLPRDGAEPAQFALPGFGVVNDVQLSARQGLFGYLFSSSDPSAVDAHKSELFVANMNDPLADPVQVTSLSDQRIVQWRAVPQTSRAVALGFDGLLWLVDLARPDAEAVALGNALDLDYLEQGASRVLVHRNEGFFVIDLVTLLESEYSLPGALPEGFTVQQAITPLADGSAVMVASKNDAAGQPEPLRVFFVSAAGSARQLFDVGSDADSLLQVCPSPDGGQIAVAVAPNIVANPFDLYQRPRPSRVETRFVETVSGRVVATERGFDVSWCRGEA